MEQEVELLHGFRQILVDIEDGLVMEGHWVEASHVCALRHTPNCTLSVLIILLEIKDSSLEV